MCVQWWWYIRKGLGQQFINVRKTRWRRFENEILVRLCYGSVGVRCRRWLWCRRTEYEVWIGTQGIGWGDATDHMTDHVIGQTCESKKGIVEEYMVHFSMQMKKNKKNKVPQKVDILNEHITIQSKNALIYIYLVNP